MGFADEVKATQSVSHAAAPAPAAEPAAAAPAEPQLMSPTLDGEAPAVALRADDALPGGAAPLDPAVKAADDARRDLEAKAASKANAKVTVAGKDFASVEEALAYAEQLEITNREQKAFQDGVETAAKAVAPKEQPKPEPTFIQRAKDLMFEDPEAAIALIVEGTQKQIFTAYGKMTEQQAAEAVRQQQVETMWNNFYAKNADLAELRDFVDYTSKKHWNEIKDLPTDQGLQKLAEYTRKGAKLTKEAAMPSLELQSRAAITAGASSQATPQNAESTEPNLTDFVQQLRSLRARSKA